jgi:hypothetical protein
MRLFTKSQLGKLQHKLFSENSPHIVKAFLESQDKKEDIDSLLKRLEPITEGMALEFFEKIIKELVRMDVDIAPIREMLDKEGLLDWEKLSGE